MPINHFSIFNLEKNIVSSNLTTTCRACIKNMDSPGKVVNCPLYKTKRRYGKLVNNTCTTILCCEKTKTTQLFRDKLEALSYAFYDLKLPINQIQSEVKEKEQKRVNRLVHNLTSINAKNIQEIYALVPQEILTSDFNKQIPKISEIVSENPDETAVMFLRMAKHSLHMKSEFSIYRKLDRNNPTLDKKKHPIHKVLMNILHSFFIDFSDKDVYVDVGECHEQVICDYESIQVAFYHLIENASKYVKPKSTVNIDFVLVEQKLFLKIKMDSLYIELEEKGLIFTEGYSGKEARKTYKDGDGIGMWRIKQMLELNDFDIELNAGEEIENLNGFRFSKNEFIICMNRLKS